MSNTLKDIFTKPRNYSSALLEKFEEMPDARSNYIIAMTPRSGSSYLCDTLKRKKIFGNPDERMNHNFLPSILEKIPGPDADTYLRNVFRHSRSKNGIAGLKASWFQFNNFAQSMQSPEALTKCRFIYLYRRDSAQQAVSLYLATESNVFHTNTKHTQDELQKLEKLEYDYARIDHWHEHILRQEQGWKRYFEQNAINPLAITYEDILEDLPCLLRRFARQVGVQPKHATPPEDQSIFKKIGDSRNYEWACRYTLEKYRREAELESAASARIAP